MSIAPWRLHMGDIQLLVEWRETSRGTLVAGAPEMRAALAVLDRVATSDCTVLVTGESGTGKELAIAALHDASARRQGPLVAVNCGAIPENLVESELFGHARGAFTGASGARKGFIAEAEGGTLFLDEIGELSLNVQVKLLRLLQSKEYNVVGESKSTRSNARIAAATNRDLAAEVRAGRFREDLYYRLNVIHVELPPLRKRRQDIERLATHFLKRSADRLGRDIYGFSRPAMDRITSSDWPGNVRALENAIERAVLLARGPYIEVDGMQPAPSFRSAHAPAVVVTSSAPQSATTTSGRRRAFSLPPMPAIDPERGCDLRATMAAYETQILLKVLDSVHWNRSRAARRLGIQRTTLIDMIRRKGLSAPPARAV